MKALARRKFAASRFVLLAVAFALSGCVSLGAEPPESLLNLSANVSAPTGSATSVSGADAVAVHTPEVPARLDVLRIPVKVSDTEIAYLQDAFWVEKPARLFRRLIGETLRARRGGLVLDTDDAPLVAEIALRGTLREFGYDAQRSAVVVQFDAIRSRDRGADDSSFETRRFEAIEQGVAPESGAVGAALNRAANSVAGEVADWLAEPES
ncbi:MAG: ABC-type transport auxiliary lipoprotein family protein [Erythrobacter sp.]